MDDEVMRSMWKGGSTPTADPHICPYRPDGANKQSCVDISGKNVPLNEGGCCGTLRGTVRFDPCNFVARRCRVCLQIGRRGLKANVVTNVKSGTCEEHEKGVPSEMREFRIPETPRRAIAIELGVGVQRIRPTSAPSVPAAAPASAKPPAGDKPVVTAKETSILAESVKGGPACSTKRRTTTEQKVLALSSVAAAAGDPRSLRACDLVASAALRLNTAKTAVRTCWARNLSRSQRKFLLYGERGKKITRSEQKFTILLSLREEMRKSGKPAPTKKEFIELAAKPLGMTPFSTATYIYDRLTTDQCATLEFALPSNNTGLSVAEQFAVLKRVRAEMKNKGLPPPRHIDLAEAAAPALKQKVSSVRTLIGSLTDEQKNELDLLQSRSGKLKGLDPALIREGFVGAFAVLRLRRLPATLNNIRQVLRFKPGVIESYLEHNLDINALVVDEPKT